MIYAQNLKKEVMEGNDGQYFLEVMFQNPMKKTKYLPCRRVKGKVNTEFNRVSMSWYFTSDINTPLLLAAVKEITIVKKVGGDFLPLASIINEETRPLDPGDTLTISQPVVISWS